MHFGPSVSPVVDVCLFKNKSILLRYIHEDIDLIVRLVLVSFFAFCF